MTDHDLGESRFWYQNRSFSRDSCHWGSQGPCSKLFCSVWKKAVGLSDLHRVSPVEFPLSPGSWGPREQSYGGGHLSFGRRRRPALSTGGISSCCHERIREPQKDAHFTAFLLGSSSDGPQRCTPALLLNGSSPGRGHTVHASPLNSNHFS